MRQGFGFPIYLVLEKAAGNTHHYWSVKLETMITKKYNLERIHENLSVFYSTHKKSIKVGFALFWLCLIGYVIYLGWQSRTELIYLVNNADWSHFTFVLLLYLATLILASTIWAIIMQAMDGSLEWWTHVCIYFVTLMTRRIPGTVWYIGGRVVLYKQFGVSGIKTATGSGIELIISFVANCILAMLFLPFGLSLSNYWFIPFGIATLLGLIILEPSILAKIMIKLKRPLPSPIERWRIVIWLLLRMLLVLVGGLMIFQTIRVFLPLTKETLFLVLGARAISGAASMLSFFLPSSMGIYDLTMIAFLSTIMPPSLAAVVTVLVKLYSTFFEILFGLIFFIIIRKSPESRSININLFSRNVSDIGITPEPDLDNEAK